MQRWNNECMLSLAQPLFAKLHKRKRACNPNDKLIQDIKTHFNDHKVINMLFDCRWVFCLFY